MFYRVNYIKTNTGVIANFTYYAETFAVSHLSVQNGATFGETEFFESDIQGWQHAAELIDTKADIRSPALIGSPTSTTPALTTNSDRIATTAFVHSMADSIIAPVETSITKASRNYSAGEYLICQGKLFKVTAAIAQNTAITIGTNAEQTTVMQEMVSLLS